MLLMLILVLVFVAILLLSLQAIPFVTGELHKIQEKKVKQATKKFDEMYITIKKEKLIAFYSVGPAALAFLAFIIFKNIILAFFIGLFGLALPRLFLKSLEARRRQRFSGQIVDGLMVIASSLKAGLSILQAIEVLTEEMPVPISQEFGLVLRENKMGVPLEESLNHLNKKMNLSELNMVINAIQVAKETGGDLTKVLSRVCTSIRDNRKLKESIKTLTLQGKIQGYIMSLLPIFFCSWVISFNRHHFDIMFQSETGRMLLFVAVFLQIVGMILIWKFSTIKI